MTVSINGTSGIVFNDNTTQNSASTAGLVNKIINSDMMIDQRNAGASVTITASSSNQYVLDRFYLRSETTGGSKVSVQRSTVAPTGFVNSQLLTSLSAYTLGASEHCSTTQAIEGFNTADLGWGTANAQTVTLSFWVRSSLTGTFGGGLVNSAGNRCYVFSYTINAANTWEQKTVTIAGDTSGTWLTDNGTGIFVNFSVGAGSSTTGAAGSWGSFFRSVTGQVNLLGTSGATFYITGVDLRKGTVGATAQTRDFRPYGTELALCQRYYEKSYLQNTRVPTTVSDAYVSLPVGSNTYFGGSGASQQVLGSVFYKVTKRANATITIYSWSNNTPTAVSQGWTGADFAANSGVINSSGEQSFSIYNGTGSNITTGGYSVLFHYAASAEL